MTSEMALTLKSDGQHGNIPDIGAEIIIELNSGVIQSIRALSKLPFPIKVHIKDHDLIRTKEGQPHPIWLLGLPDEAIGD